MFKHYKRKTLRHLPTDCNIRTNTEFIQQKNNSQDHWYLLPFNGHFFQLDPVSRFSLKSFCTCCRREPRRISGMGFFTGQMSSCYQTISAKTLKETRSTDYNQCPALILSLSTTKLLMKRSLLLLSQLSNPNRPVGIY